MDRRKFLLRCGSLGLGGTLGSVLLPACGGSKYLAVAASGNRLIVNKTDMADQEAIVVSNNRLPAPVFLLRLPEGEYSAVLLLCTHKQCEVAPSGAILQCPCHGSEYTKTGRVLEGPATRDLAILKTESDEEHIYILF